MKLYNANLSPNALRVRAVANELGMELETVDLDFTKGEHKAASYLVLNPNGKVPTLVDGDVVLWESRAIVAYLAGLKPDSGLVPAVPRQHAVVDQWCYWDAVHLSPNMQRVVFERFVKKLFGRGEPDDSVIQGQLAEVAALVPILDANLAGREWVAGRLSIADFTLASTFVYRRQGRISLDAAPNVVAWLDRIEQRPSWQAAVRPLQEMLKR